jgi:hypothetical protein
MKFRMITSGESSIVVVHRKGKERGGEQMRPECPSSGAGIPVDSMNEF